MLEFFGLTCCSSIENAKPATLVTLHGAPGSGKASERPVVPRKRTSGCQTRQARVAAHAEALLWACTNRDVHEARRLLSLDDPHLPMARTVRDSRGFGALHFACASGCLPIVKMLCEAPHKVDPTEYIPGCPMDSPLMLAARHGRLDVLEYLADAHNALSAYNAPPGWADWNAMLPEYESCEEQNIENPLLPAIGDTQQAQRGEPAGSSSSRRMPGVLAFPAGERRNAVRRYLERRLSKRGAQPLELPEQKDVELHSAKSTATGGSREGECDQSCFSSAPNSRCASRQSSVASRGCSGSPTLREKRGLCCLVVETSKRERTFAEAAAAPKPERVPPRAPEVPRRQSSEAFAASARSGFGTLGDLKKLRDGLGQLKPFL